jgi:sec-independent protein translocase protein TatC
MKDETTELAVQTGEPDEEEEIESGKMSFLEHLDELRKRLLHIITYVGIGLVASFYFARQIYAFLSMPITRLYPGGLKLVFTNPTQPFTLYIKVALLAGVFLTIPLTLYEVWRFIAPGLYRKEKKYVVPFMMSSMILFVGGAAFCYTIVLPQAYSFLLNIGKDFVPMITVDEYMDLTLMMLLGFGLIFEMPVIVAFLSLFGLVSAHFLWSKFKYAIVLIVALAAVLSPTGDAFNLLIWAAPMVVLYIVSIGVAALFGWRRRVKGLD